MIARTRRIRVSVSALLIPLHDPLRLAEDIALLDTAAPGRFSATAGLGYRREEYDSFGVDWESRGKVFDEKLDVLVPALKGDSFEYRGQTLGPRQTLEPEARLRREAGGQRSRQEQSDAASQQQGTKWGSR